MTRIPLVLLALLTFAGGCVDGTAPVAEEGPSVMKALGLELAPPPAAVAQVILPINVLRVTLYRGAPGTGERITQLVFDGDDGIDPNAATWTVDVPVRVPESGSETFSLVVEMIHRDASGGESVQYHSITEGIVISASSPTNTVVRAAGAVQGPPQNSAVRGVELFAQNTIMQEGSSLTVTAAVNHSAATPPEVVWVVEPANVIAPAPVRQPVGPNGRATTQVQGIAPGTATLTAVVGSFNASVQIEVVARPTGLVILSPQRDAAVGDLVEFTAEVRDARGAAIPGAPVLWEVLTPRILQEISPGSFRVIGPGQGQVRATAANAPSLTALATVTVAAVEADLAVTKTASVSEILEGGEVVFTVSATNQGPGIAGAVEVVDRADEGLRLVEAETATGSFAAETGVWSVGILEPSASATLRLRYTAIEGSGGARLANRVTIGSTATDPVEENNRAEAVVLVLAPSTDLRITKEALDRQVLPGGTTLFEITVTNPGTRPVPGVVVTDTPGEGLLLESGGATQGDFDPRTGVWTVGTLEAGRSAILEVAVGVSDRAEPTARLVNAARITRADAPDPDESNNEATAAVEVGSSVANVSVTKTVSGPSAVRPGDEIVYTVVVTNDGPGVATDVVLYEPTPTGGGVPPVGDPILTLSQGTFDYSEGEWLAGQLAPGQSATLTITATVGVSGTPGTFPVTNVIEVRESEEWTDPDTEDNSASATYVYENVTADLSVSKYDLNEGIVSEGGQVVFVVDVTNNNNFIAASNVVIDEVMPAGLTFVSSTPGAPAFDAQTGVWNVGNLPAGGYATLEIVMEAPVGTAGQSFTNTAELAGSTPLDGTPGNNSADATVTVLGSGLAPVTFAFPHNTTLAGGNIIPPVTGPALGAGRVRGGVQTLVEPGTPFAVVPDGILPSGETRTIVSVDHPGCDGFQCAGLFGRLEWQPDGTFIYDPSPDRQNSTSLEFTLSDATTGTVTFDPSPTRILWVDGDVAGPGAGTSWDPFASPADAEAAAGPGDVIVLQRASSPYEYALTLQDGQVLAGSGEPLTVDGFPILPGGLATEMQVALPSVTLASGNTVQGIAFVPGLSGSSIAIYGGGVTGGTVKGVTMAGGGVELISTSGSFLFDRFAILSGADGFGIYGGNPDVDVNLTTDGIKVNAFDGYPFYVTDLTGGSVHVSGGPIEGLDSGDITFFQNAAPITIDAPVQLSGLDAFIFAMYVDAPIRFLQPVSISGSNDISVFQQFGTSTLSFEGGLDIQADHTDAAVQAYDAGSIEILGSGNVITNTSGPVVTFDGGATIGPGGITLERVEANGGGNGIRLSQAAHMGPFEVTGTGSPGSGGVLENHTGQGVVLAGNGNTPVTLRDMTIRNSASSGLLLTGAGTVTLDGVVMHDNGASTGGSSVDVSAFTGTLNVLSSAILAPATPQGSQHGIVLAVSDNRSVRLNVDGTNIEGFGGSASAGIFGSTSLSGTLDASIRNSFLGSVSTPNQSGIFISYGGSGQHQLLAQGNFTSNPVTGYWLTTSDGASLTAHLDQNDVVDSQFFGVHVQHGSSGTAEVTLTGNNLDPDGLSSSSVGGQVVADGTGPLVTRIENNTIAGVDLGLSTGHASSSGSAAVDLRIVGNTIASQGSGPGLSIQYQAPGGFCGFVENISGSPAISSSQGDYAFTFLQGPSVTSPARIEGLNGGSGNVAAPLVEAWFQASNAMIPSVPGVFDGTSPTPLGFDGVPLGTCAVPSLPSLGAGPTPPR